MTAPEYEPGTLAVATVRGVEGVRVMRTQAQVGCYCWYSINRVSDYHWHELSHVTDVRPLVLIDPEDHLQVGRLAAAYDFPQHGAERMQAALRSLIAPPRPPEPQGLGAVVEDAEGQRWVRFKQADVLPWRLNLPGDADSARRAYYRDLPAVRILSEGVTP